ncbi:hypothetical protein [Alteromonas sp. a30]|uniref:hypothetical protein n=1 Tax=Alteromonas sp. a30 TaxID=2730917 RepID=UPI002280D7D7|nr:hypothetical protein [Alteromonas sp. a30]MCY7295358.1 hypothetical protein [Alteromonas sp. a30]
MKLKLYALALVCAFSNVAFAESLATAMKKCSQVDNSLKRLVCYDQLNQKANGYQDSQLPTQVNRQGPPQGRNQSAQVYQQVPQYASNQANDPVDNFGKPILETIKREDLDSLSAQVTEIKKDRRGKLTITLDNGQVWQQTDSKSILLRKGNSVVLEKGLLGAYFLKESSSTNRIRVERKS